MIQTSTMTVLHIRRRHQGAMALLSSLCLVLLGLDLRLVAGSSSSGNIRQQQHPHDYHLLHHNDHHHDDRNRRLLRKGTLYKNGVGSNTREWEEESDNEGPKKGGNAPKQSGDVRTAGAAAKGAESVDVFLPDDTVANEAPAARQWQDNNPDISWGTRWIGEDGDFVVEEIPKEKQDEPGKGKQEELGKGKQEDVQDRHGHEGDRDPLLDFVETKPYHEERQGQGQDQDDRDPDLDLDLVAGPGPYHGEQVVVADRKGGGDKGGGDKKENANFKRKGEGVSGGEEKQKDSNGKRAGDESGGEKQKDSNVKRAGSGIGKQKVSNVKRAGAKLKAKSGGGVKGRESKMMKKKRTRHLEDRYAAARAEQKHSGIFQSRDDGVGRSTTVNMSEDEMARKGGSLAEKALKKFDTIDIPLWSNREWNLTFFSDDGKGKGADVNETEAGKGKDKDNKEFAARDADVNGTEAEISREIDNKAEKAKPKGAKSDDSQDDIQRDEVIEEKSNNTESLGGDEVPAAALLHDVAPEYFNAALNKTEQLAFKEVIASRDEAKEQPETGPQTGEAPTDHEQAPVEPEVGMITRPHDVNAAISDVATAINESALNETEKAVLLEQATLAQQSNSEFTVQQVMSNIYREITQREMSNDSPSAMPRSSPSQTPSGSPSQIPSGNPTGTPTSSPTGSSSTIARIVAIGHPSAAPTTASPTTATPTINPTGVPSSGPSYGATSAQNEAPEERSDEGTPSQVASIAREIPTSNEEFAWEDQTDDFWWDESVPTAMPTLNPTTLSPSQHPTSSSKPSQPPSPEPTEDRTDCRICPNGRAATYPDRTILHTKQTCQELAGELDFATVESCRELKAGIPIDAAAYCGCEEVSFTSSCTFCPDGTSNLYKAVTIPSLNLMSCGDVEFYTSYITNQTACEKMGHLADLCCGSWGTSVGRSSRLFTNDKSRRRDWGSGDEAGGGENGAS